MIALLAALLVATAAAATPITEIHYVMGTYLRIVADAQARPAMRACFTEARRLDRVFSRFDPASELNRVNAAAGTKTSVSTDFATLLARSLALGRASGGAFDVTVGPLVALWRQAGATPGSVELAAARRGVGGGRARLRGDRLTLAPDAALDFDGIAKGFAVDACVARLRAAGAGPALVSFGESSLYALGRPAGEEGWELAVRGPGDGKLHGRLRLRDEAASVSATVADDPPAGARIVDPRTGWALREPAVAIAVAPSATDAEAWSKAVLVWGRGGAARAERSGASAAIRLAGGAVEVGPAAARAGTFADRASTPALAAGMGALR
jgi:thiamine biosynthesis lipoprotein